MQNLMVSHSCIYHISSIVLFYSQRYKLDFQKLKDQILHHNTNIYLTSLAPHDTK